MYLDPPRNLIIKMLDTPSEYQTFQCLMLRGCLLLSPGLGVWSGVGMYVVLPVLYLRGCPVDGEGGLVGKRG